MTLCLEENKIVVFFDNHRRPIQLRERLRERERERERERSAMWWLALLPAQFMHTSRWQNLFTSESACEVAARNSAREYQGVVPVATDCRYSTHCRYCVTKEPNSSLFWFYSTGGEGVQKSRKTADVVYKRPLVCRVRENVYNRKIHRNRLINIVFHIFLFDTFLRQEA